MTPLLLASLLAALPLLPATTPSSPVSSAPHPFLITDRIQFVLGGGVQGFSVSGDPSAIVYVELGKKRLVKQTKFDGSGTAILGELPWDFELAFAIPHDPDHVLVQEQGRGGAGRVAVLDVPKGALTDLTVGRGGAVVSIAPSGRFAIVGVDITCWGDSQDCMCPSFDLLSLPSGDRRRTIPTDVRSQSATVGSTESPGVHDKTGHATGQVAFSWLVDDSLLVTRTQPSGLHATEKLWPGNVGLSSSEEVPEREVIDQTISRSVLRKAPVAVKLGHRGETVPVALRELFSKRRVESEVTFHPVSDTEVVVICRDGWTVEAARLRAPR